MSINIVDRRKNPKGKSSENRQRFIKRISGQIKKALPDIVKNTNVKDITSKDKKVKVPVKGIKEPQFTYDKDTGDKKNVHPGNKEYIEGDKIKKPGGSRHFDLTIINMKSKRIHLYNGACSMYLSIIFTI